MYDARSVYYSAVASAAAELIIIARCRAGKQFSRRQGITERSACEEMGRPGRLNANENATGLRICRDQREEGDWAPRQNAKLPTELPWAQQWARAMAARCTGSGRPKPEVVDKSAEPRR